MIGKSSLVNTNKLVRNYNGCTGLKTGSTSTALFNLSASATRDGFSLIAVVMRAPTSSVRFKNASTLLDYGFTNYEYKSLVEKDDIIQNVKIQKGILPDVNILADNSVGCIVSKGQEVNIEQNINIPQTIEAPIKKGDIVGTVSFTLNGSIIGESNLISEKDISKIGFLSMNKHILGKWLNLLR